MMPAQIIRWRQVHYPVGGIPQNTSFTKDESPLTVSLYSKEDNQLKAVCIARWGELSKQIP
jgi:hypothetical protein